MADIGGIGNFLKELAASTVAPVVEVGAPVAAAVTEPDDPDKVAVARVKKELTKALKESEKVIKADHAWNQDLKNIIAAFAKIVALKTQIAAADSEEKAALQPDLTKATQNLIAVMKTGNKDLAKQLETPGIDPNTLFKVPDAAPVVAAFSKACEDLMAEVLNNSAMRRGLSSLQNILFIWLGGLVNLKRPTASAKSGTKRGTGGAGAAAKSPKAAPAPKPKPCLLNNVYFCQLIADIATGAMSLSAMRYIMDRSSVSANTEWLVGEIQTHCAECWPKTETFDLSGEGFEKVKKIDGLHQYRQVGPAAARYKEVLNEAKRAKKEAEDLSASKTELVNLHAEQLRAEEILNDAISNMLAARRASRLKEGIIGEYEGKEPERMKLSKPLGFMYAQLSKSFDSVNRGLILVFPKNLELTPTEKEPMVPDSHIPGDTQHLAICPVLETGRTSGTTTLRDRYVTKYLAWTTRELEGQICLVGSPREVQINRYVATASMVDELSDKKWKHLELGLVKKPLVRNLANPHKSDSLSKCVREVLKHKGPSTISIDKDKRKPKVYEFAMDDLTAVKAQVETIQSLETLQAALAKDQEAADRDRRIKSTPIPRKRRQVGTGDDGSGKPVDVTGEEADEDAPAPTAAEIADATTPAATKTFTMGLDVPPHALGAGSFARASPVTPDEAEAAAVADEDDESAPGGTDADAE